MSESTGRPMTKGERDELARLIRQRAKVDKANIDARRAELLADFEATMATEWRSQDEIAKDLVDEALAIVRRSNQELRQRCIERGVPESFAPSLDLGWHRRGENVDKDRRVELRKVAETRLDAMARRAKLRVDEVEVATLGRLVAHSVTTALGVEFLAAMPAVGELMRPLDRSEIEAAVPIRKEEPRRI